MKKNNPMRIRRRQSDAKWRASVASCFETLKYLISEKKNKVITKRKASKALILQETDKYITLLEEILPKLLDERNTLMAFTGGVCQSVDDVKQDFDGKQRTLFQQSCTGRRRYHIPIDLEVANICDLSNETSIKTVEQARKQLEEMEQQRTAEKQQLLKKKQSIKVQKDLEKQQKKDKSPLCSLSTIRVRMPLDARSGIKTEREESDPQTLNFALSGEESYSAKKIDGVNQISTPNFTYPVTPSRNTWSCEYEASEDVFSPFSACLYGDCFTSESPLKHATLTSRQAAKVIKKLPFDSSLDLSPCAKSAENLYHYFEFTPLKSAVSATNVVDTSQFQRSLHPSVGESDDEDGLFCTERIETMDLDGELSEEDRRGIMADTENTPQITSRWSDGGFGRKTRISKRSFGAETVERKPKCRRQLEMDFPRDESLLDEKVLPVINGVFQNDECLDFDSYFLFYQHVAEQYQNDLEISMEDIRDPKFATMVSEMWQKMSLEQREAMATIAAMEYSQESDNSNLSDDLMHLDVKPLTKTTNSSYLSTDTELELPPVQTNQVVPSNEVTPIQFSKFKFSNLLAEETKGDDEDLQIVPSILRVAEENEWCGPLTSKCQLDVPSDSTELLATDNGDKYECFVDISCQRVPDLPLLEEVGVVELEVATNGGFGDRNKHSII